MLVLVQICSLLLLTLVTAERVNPAPNNAPESSNLELYHQLKSVPPDEWAMHDWVPQKNRLSNDRGLPVGNGELEEMRGVRRMHTKRHQRGKQRGPRPHKISKKADSHIDLLKKHILINRKHMTENKQEEKLKREKRTRHGKDKKRVGQGSQTSRHA